MQTGRRRFFGALLGGAAAGAAVVTAEAPQPLPHPRNRLDEFNQQFVGYQQAERVGNWSIFFTGYKSSMDFSSVAGQWLAWPRADLPIEERRKIDQYFYASVPKPKDCPDGHFDGEYPPGACFRIDGSAQLGMFSTPDGVRQLQEWVAEGRERLIRIMRAAGAI